MSKTVDLKLKTYSLMLDPRAVAMIHQALQELPAKHSRTLLESIEDQVARQNAAAALPKDKRKAAADGEAKA